MAIAGALHEAKLYIRDQAEKAGLDFFEVIFELLDADQMNAVAAYGGFPNRYPHWRFGMEYERLNKTYTYGLSKIYEMVVNNDPCYAYLLRSNNVVDQKMVMAHVYGHSDFFKNNIHFNHTNRKMMDEAGNHRSKIQRLMMRQGQDVVEDFIDLCLSIENLVDVNSPMRPVKRQGVRQENKSRDAVAEDAAEPVKHERPDRDVLLYLLERAPLTGWQQEVLSIIREEAYYFVPQRMTKIMNEGWASYWHSHLMTQDVLHDSEVIDYAERHAGTMQTSGGVINPYKIGIELFRDIEQRWNEGRFGRSYDECDDMQKRDTWNMNLEAGRKKIFEVRRLNNDLTFLDTYMTPEFCEKHQLFTYVYDPKSAQYEIQSRDFEQVRKKLLQQLTNGGNPVVEVISDAAPRQGDLYLRHIHEGVDLRIDYARETLQYLYRMWKRPVYLETEVDDVPKLLCYDGTEHRETRVT